MKRRLYVLRALMVVSVVLMVAACAPSQAAAPAAAGAQGAATPPANGARTAAGGPGAQVAAVRAVPVEVTQAKTGSISQVYAYAGTLDAKDTVKVSPLASGRIATVLARVGDTLKAGDPIAQIEQTTFQAQVDQAQAGYDAAQQKLVRMQIGSRPEEIAAAEAAVRAAQVAIDASLTPTNDQRTVAAAAMAKAQTALQQAQHDYDKVAYGDSAGTSPQAAALQQATIAYDSAVASYNLTIKPTDGQLAPLQNSLAQAQLHLALTKTPYLASDLAQAQAAVNQAKAALDLAKAQLDYTIIRAPFAGTVAEVYISQGDLVGPTAPVATFISRNDEVALDIEESRIGQIKVGQDAALRVSAYPGQDFAAVVTEVSPMADPKTHTFQIKVTPSDDRGLLRSGMYADVSLLTAEKPNAVLVPLAAITQDNNNSPAVYVVRSDNTAEMQTVQTGISNNDSIEVVSGLRPGDTVVTAGLSNLTNGSRVQIARGG